MSRNHWIQTLFSVLRKWSVCAVYSLGRLATATAMPYSSGCLLSIGCAATLLSVCRRCCW